MLRRQSSPFSQKIANGRFMQTRNTLDQIMPGARKILIAIFNCYGDSFIGARIANEFIEKWHGDGRQFLIVTPPHLAPHIRMICKGAEVMALRSKNPWHWIRLAYRVFVSHSGFDVAFNPNSFAKVSCRLITWAKWSRQWKEWSNWYRQNRGVDEVPIPNYYDKVRAYFGLPQRGEFDATDRALGTPDRILVCPDSGEERRSLTVDQISLLTDKLRATWPRAEISVATSDRSRAGSFKAVLLDKTKEASQRYLDALIETQLVVTVDSGTLHLADALGKPLLCLFSSSMPATVLNHDANALAVRLASLDGVYCEIKSCRHPHCMDDLVVNFAEHHAVNCRGRRIETTRCPAFGDPGGECI